MDDFYEGQAVLYNRSRSGRRSTQDIPAAYVGECEPWGNGFTPHKILCVLDGVERTLFVSINALRPDMSKPYTLRNVSTGHADVYSQDGKTHIGYVEGATRSWQTFGPNGEYIMGGFHESRDGAARRVLEWAEDHGRIGAAPTTGENRIAQLEHALRFYADPTRYAGSNKLPKPGDPYTPEGAAFMVDIRRDGGQIARAVLGHGNGRGRRE